MRGVWLKVKLPYMYLNAVSFQTNSTVGIILK
jgi:hypothetical protein